MRSARPVVAALLALMTLLVAGMLPARPAAAATGSYSFGAPIGIVDNSIATPYPAAVSVSGLAGTVSQVTITLTNLTHTRPNDIDIALVGPTGASLIVLSDVGDNTSATNITITLDDTAATPLPNGAPLVGGTYKPTNYGAGDVFPAPGPGSPSSGTFASVFNGTNPNGLWSLYVVDDNASEAGSIGNWTLNLTTTTLPTTTTVTATPNPANYGQASFTLTANVSPAAATGNVNFYVGSYPGGYVGSAPLSGGVATFTYTPPALLAPGSYLVVAEYAGDLSYSPGTGSTTLVVNTNSTTTSVTAAPNPAAYGTSPIVFTANVTAPSGTPTGNVNFFVITTPGDPNYNAYYVGSSPLSGGVASYNYAPATPLNPGTYRIVAEYAGATGYTASTGDTQLVINKADTTTSNVTVSPVSVVYGTANVTLSATVSSNVAITAGGSVNFAVAGGACSSFSQNPVPVPAGPSPQTVTTTCNLNAAVGAGNYTITATYSGNTQLNGSSGTGTLTITKATTITTISPINSAPACGEPAALQVFAVVQNTSNGAYFNFGSGTVAFTLKQGATTIATATSGPVNGNASAIPVTASFNISALPIGTYTVEAVFSGDDKFQTSTATPVTFTITKANTTTTVQDVSAVYGDSSVTLTANVARNPAAGPVNGGTVTFTIKKGQNTIGTASGTVSNGQATATFPINGLNAGNYTISAVYSGTDTCYNGSQTTANGTLKIAKRILFVQPKPQSRTSTQANPGCTSINDVQVVNQQGNVLVNGDTLASATTLGPGFGCTYTVPGGTTARPTRPGTYDISVNNILSTNYDIRYRTGVLTVTP